MRTDTSIYPSSHPSIYPSIHSYIHPSIHPYNHTSIHTSIHTFIFPSARRSPWRHFGRARLHLFICFLRAEPFVSLRADCQAGCAVGRLVGRKVIHAPSNLVIQWQGDFFFCNRLISLCHCEKLHGVINQTYD